MHYHMALIAAVLLIAAGCASTGSGDSSTQPDAVEAAAAEAAGVEQDPASGDTAATGYDPAEAVAAATGTTADDWICKRERLTGSNRMHKICRAGDKADEDRYKTQDVIRTWKRNSSESARSR